MEAQTNGIVVLEPQGIERQAAVVGRPMVFAPVNEMGVVFLFGTMAEKLGFMVTWIGTAYPDGEAWREVEPGRWAAGTN